MITPDDQPTIERIARQLRDGRVAFLLGSGASAASRLPVGNALSISLIREIVGNAAPQKELERLASLYPLEAIGSAFRTVTDAPFLQQLIRGTYTTDVQPTAVHDHLRYFADRRYIDRIYTTNFDTLIERAISETRTLSITDSNFDQMYDRNDVARFPVIHLHGTADSTPLIAEDDTYRLETPLGRLFAADLVTKYFVFIGYSMNDVDLRSVHLATLSLLGGTSSQAKRQYAVHPAKTDSERLLSEKVWAGRSITYICASADDFASQLRDHVENERQIHLTKAILIKTGRDPNDPNQIAELHKQVEATIAGHSANSVIDAYEMIARTVGVDGVREI